MKKFAVAFALVVASSVAHADSMVTLNPMAIALGGVGLQYQQSMDKNTGWTVDYQSITIGSASASLIGGSYKAAFEGSTFGKGVYWRAGAVSVSGSAGGYSAGVVLPTATVGYDYPVNDSVLVNFDFGLGGYAGLQVGMMF
jgi:hypothetical protein